MKITTTLIGLSLLATPVTPLMAADKADNKQQAEQQPQDPAGYLEMTKEFSGKCMGLRRGDMRLIVNNHPDKTIQYRLIRKLGGKRQASIIQDTIKPGSEGHKLGCELLDDREQTWEIVRAQYVEE